MLYKYTSNFQVFLIYILASAQWMNVALTTAGGVATARSQQSNSNKAQLAIDGKTGHPGWASHSRFASTHLSWINVTFNGTFEICHARIMNRLANFYKEIRLSFSDGSSQKVCNLFHLFHYLVL